VLEYLRHKLFQFDHPMTEQEQVRIEVSVPPPTA